MRYRYRLYTNVQSIVHGEPERLSDVTHFRGYLPGDRVTLSYEGEVDVAEELLELAAHLIVNLHNVDDRPTAQTCPSASVGDVVVIDTPDGPVGFALDHEGFQLVFEPANVDARPYREIAYR